MNTLAEATEKSTVSIETIERNTATGSLYNSEYLQERARSGTQQSYHFWLHSNLEKDVGLSDSSMSWVYRFFSSEPAPANKYARSRILEMLEEEGLSKPFLLNEHYADALKELSHITLSLNRLLSLKYEEEIEVATGPPDEYSVEGIHIDWKSAFKWHEELNTLRAKHGIRRI